jgi:adenylate cyclase
MNPNLCTICETNFTKVKKKKQITIPTTVMFADVRGYTSLSETVETTEMANVLHCFYDECASAIWERDGIVNKFIGDAVLAIFNFPIMREDHVRQAVLAGVELQKKCCEKKELVLAGLDGEEMPIAVGIGIHTGDTSIGELGTSYKDFTAIGPVVNLASRIQGQAKPGEILVTGDVYCQVEDLFPDADTRICELKGIEKPVKTYALRTSPDETILGN